MYGQNHSHNHLSREGVRVAPAWPLLAQLV